jgi:predicted glycoside hydrolase/deacetylase ChbG (UPF0249 family)
MKQTIVGIFETPLSANETVHVLKSAGFVAERIPRQARQRATDELRPLPSRVIGAITRKIRAFMDADMYLSPFASALAQGRFVVKVHAAHVAEAVAARRILEVAGAKEIDALTDDRVES